MISLFSIKTESTVSIEKKPRKKTQNKRKDVIKKQNEEQIDFECLMPFKSDVLMVDGHNQTRLLRDNYICPKDFLQAHLFRYMPSFVKKVKHQPRTSLRRNTQTFIKDSKVLTMNSGYIDQSMMETSFNANLLSTLDKKSHLKFREASLPIKELKKKIRSGAKIGSEINFT